MDARERKSSSLAQQHPPAHNSRESAASSSLSTDLLVPPSSKAAAVDTSVSQQIRSKHSRDLLEDKEDHDRRKDRRGIMSRVWIFVSSLCCGLNSVRWTVLLILCLQNSLFTVLRRYSQGVLKENYSKYEVLLFGEIVKMVFSAYMIQQDLLAQGGKATSLASSSMDDAANSASGAGGTSAASNLAPMSLTERLIYLLETSRKMVVLALIYGAMNILSFVSLRNIGAGMFTIFAQCKILTTAICSTLILQRQYSMTQWRALLALSFGVLLFSEPIWSKSENLLHSDPNAKPLVGTVAVLIEVTLSGFASIYFEKVIKLDPLKVTIWERNFQLALGSFPIYVLFIVADGGGTAGYLGGWSMTAFIVALLGAAGGLLVALSIKYGDSILKTLATTGAIILSSVLDRVFLNGPLTPTMMIAGVQVIIAICNYTFDATPTAPAPPAQSSDKQQQTTEAAPAGLSLSSSGSFNHNNSNKGGQPSDGSDDGNHDDIDEEKALLMNKRGPVNNKSVV